LQTLGLLLLLLGMFRCRVDGLRLVLLNVGEDVRGDLKLMLREKLVAAQSKNVGVLGALSFDEALDSKGPEGVVRRASVERKLLDGLLVNGA
jgi:hypothetical protein